ncbi:hypothetical protein [Crateriforma conspicua]|uniref:hypothetical protein n=1 Tax=Crateriforma conspicua TaxID=2527996 RepID=UPI00118B4F7A|nr:hypothetical protein [Crateriforma conspicua]QDV65819.1 hypothetical protein Mal65_49920 [Crateriforma conspicua]
MLKKILFAVAPMVLFAGNVMADDNLLEMVAKLEASQDDAKVARADDDLLGQADVDALLGEEGGNDEEAIAACYRRYRSYGHFGYRSYGYRYYTPVYRSYCYPVVRHYTPVTYSYYTPVYSSYWGCW